MHDPVHLRAAAIIAHRNWAALPDEKPDQLFARAYVGAMQDLRTVAVPGSPDAAHFQEIEACLYEVVASRIYGPEGRQATGIPEYDA